MNDTVGFIEPGHGQEGKMRELCTVKSYMYCISVTEREVLLWCYGDVGERSTTQAQTADDSAPHLRGIQAIVKSIIEVKS